MVTPPAGIPTTKRTTSRQDKLAAAYETEIWPLVPARAAELLLRTVSHQPSEVVFEAGAGGGGLTMALAERMDDASRILAIEPSPTLAELARARAARSPPAAAAKVSFHVAELTPTLPIDDGAYDLAVSNLALGDTGDPAAAIAAVARALKPGGRMHVTLALRGSWGEPCDLYRDVLTEQRKPEALAALGRYEATMPDPVTAARWMEAAGLEQVTVETTRFELLFKSAREFFYAPIVELGPLPRWKRIAGSRGDEMQDVFFFVKEAIEAYFSGTVFPVTMVIGCLGGRLA
jgi:SAM-dependent methyltransferase